MRILKILTCTLFVALIMATECNAANVITNITAAFYNKAAVYGTALQGYAERLFYWCLVLDVVLMGIKCALSRDQIADTIKQFCMMLLFAGFIFAVIKHYQEWTQNLINGLKGIGTALGAGDISLAPFETGMEIVKLVIKETSITEPINSLGLVIAAGVIMVCFALMTAHIVLIKIESYIAMNAAVILLGLGGSGLLKNYAINTMRYAFSVAFKLFVMQLVLGIGMSFIKDFRTTSTNLEDIFVLIGAAVVLLALVKTIPDACVGIINGSHTGSGAGLASTAMEVGGVIAGAGFATAGLAIGGTGKTARTIGTVRDASRMASMDGQPGLGQTAKNLWQANQAARQERNSMGSIGRRMSSHMKQGLAVREAANNTPEPPKVENKET